MLLARFFPTLIARFPFSPAIAFPTDPRIESRSSLQRRGLSSLDLLLSASRHRSRPDLRETIHRFKYRHRPLLCKPLARMIVESMRHSQIKIDGATLCPIPISWFKHHQRGYNQADLLSRAVARELDLPVKHLLKQRPKDSQVGRSRTERFAAVDHVFRVRRTAVPSHVILIDDVSTTGATLDAAAAVLKHAGADRVDAFVISHDPYAKK